MNLTPNTEAASVTGAEAMSLQQQLEPVITPKSMVTHQHLEM